MLTLWTNIDKKSLETVFYCHLSIAIENTVSSDFLSTLVDCLECFRLPPIRCVNECLSMLPQNEILLPEYSPAMLRMHCPHRHPC